MTDMPYVSLSQLMMWRLLWYLHQNDDDINSDTLGVEATSEEYKNYLSGKHVYKAAAPSKNAVSAFQISCKLLSFTSEDYR